MRSMSSLLHKLRLEHPTITFFADSQFAWSPESRTVHYNTGEPQAAALLLHELSHGLLEHTTYTRDIELLAMEAAAWDKAKQLADQYHVAISDDTAEDNLDTYREWLHARSTCPACEATGYQSASATYACPACLNTWTVNEARVCALRRYSTAK